MNNDPLTSTTAHTPSRVRRTLFVACFLVALYVGTFALDTYSGGYWREVERDGHDRYSFGLSMPTAVLWQPRFGYWTPYHADWLGALYSPLVRLDRRFYHPTRYVSDPAFSTWEQASAASDWHPRFRAEYLASHAQHQ